MWCNFCVLILWPVVRIHSRLIFHLLEGALLDCNCRHRYHKVGLCQKDLDTARKAKSFSMAISI